METRLDVIVIGASQAGLAMGYHLAQQGIDFAILDAAPTIGHAWRARWDSLKLFTPAQYSGLPGLPFPAPVDHYPGKDEVAAYLESYASAVSLPVWLDEAVTSLTREPGGTFRVRTAYASYAARQVVVATGAFQKPLVPAVSRELSPEVAQLHSRDYRRPAQLPDGDVLVVGAGNSDVQIAAELAQTRRTHLAIGRRLPRLPERILGRSVFHWLERAGAMDVTVESRLGRRVRTQDLLLGDSPRIVARRDGVRIAGRVVGASGSVVRTEDGRRIEPAAVVWATGYRPDFGWIDLPVFDERGLPVQRRGVTPLPGLYFLGLAWMHTRGSGLIGWVGRDAEYLGAKIAEHRVRRSAPRAGATRSSALPRQQARRRTRASSCP